MKSSKNIFMSVSFLWISTLTYSMDEKNNGTEKIAAYNSFDEIINAGRAYEDDGNPQKAVELYSVAYHYKQLQDLMSFKELGQAIVNGDQERTRTLSGELDQEKQARKLSQELHQSKSKQKNNR